MSNFHILYTDLSYKELNRTQADKILQQQSEANNEVPHVLPHTPAMLFGTVLKDAIQCLTILGECNANLRLMEARSNLDFLYKKKYDVETASDFTSDGGSVQIHKLPLDCIENKFRKMGADKTQIEEVLRELYMDLNCNSSFDFLVTCLNKVDIANQYARDLENQNVQNKAHFRELNKQLRMQRNLNRVGMFDNNATISELNNTLKDLALTVQFREDYTMKWQNARQEQLKKQLSDVEGGVFEDNIHHFKARHYQENRVHNELEYFNNIIIDEKRKEVEGMMTKYEHDMEAMDLKIQLAENEWTNAMDRRKELEATFYKHKKKMADRNKFKENRIKANLYQDTMERSAVIIQAWWRGLLVRLQLGPHKPPNRKRGARKMG